MEPITELAEEIQQERHFKYPSLLTRVQSIFADGILVLLAMFLAAWIIDHFEATPDWIRGVLFIGLWAVYEPLAVTFGCTFGNYLMGIRVRKFSNEQKRINIIQAYARFVIKMFLGWLSFLTIQFDPQRRAIHDIVSGSVVIRATK